MTTTRIRAILSDHFGIEADDPRLADLGSVNLVSDFKADSLDMIELVMEVENEFGIDITDEAIERAMGTNGDQPLSALVALVEGVG